MKTPDRPYAELLRILKGLPPDRREMLVVRSQPFGWIIESDTRTTHGYVEKIDGGPARKIDYPDGTWERWNPGNDWSFVAYGLCKAANGDVEIERALEEAGYA